MLHRRRLHAITTVLAAAVAMNGCIGYAIGSGIDAATKRSVAPVHADSIPFALGDKVTLRLKNREHVSGRFLGVGPSSENEYQAHFNASRERLAAQSVWIPRLHDTVSIELLTDDAFVAEFRDVRLDTVVVASPNEPTERCIPAGEIRMIRGEDGRAIDGWVLESMASMSAFPSRISLALSSSDEVTRYPISSIQRIERRRTTGRWVGVVTEFALWTAVAIAFPPDFDFGPLLTFNE